MSVWQMMTRFVYALRSGYLVVESVAYILDFRGSHSIRRCGQWEHRDVLAGSFWIYAVNSLHLRS
jgi:hypothetical protein